MKILLSLPPLNQSAMTQQELLDDIQKQTAAGFSPAEIESNLLAKGIPAETIQPLISPLTASLEKMEAESKKGPKSWVFLLLAALGFVRAALQSGRGQPFFMIISLVLAIIWLVMFIQEQSKK
jgi:hypothetical protein